MVTPKHPLRSVFHTSLLLHNLNKEAERRTGLSIVQWSILDHLIGMPATSAQELSEAAGIHPSTLSQALKRLLRKELIFVAEDPRDSRKKIISLTRQGKDALDRSSRPMQQIAADLAPAESALYRVEECLGRVLIVKRLDQSEGGPSDS
jgi:DNA-binding MarR family transcriptional regulator